MKLSELITKHGDIFIDECKFDSVIFGGNQEIDENPVELKKIDMSVCMESDIDCEFSMVESFRGYIHINKLFDNSHTKYPYCRPRMNHIHANPNGWDKCPLPKGFAIKVLTTAYDGSPLITSETNYTKWFWKDITMFEVTGIAEGYEL